MDDAIEGHHRGTSSRRRAHGWRIAGGQDKPAFVSNLSPQILVRQLYGWSGEVACEHGNLLSSVTAGPADRLPVIGPSRLVAIMGASTAAHIRTNHVNEYVVLSVGRYVIAAKGDSALRYQTSRRRTAVAAASRRFAAPSLPRRCET